VALSGQEFLRYFQKEGFLLLDLCERPVNNLSSRERSQQRLLGEASLTATLSYLPEGTQVVVAMAAIRRHVETAVARTKRPDLKISAVLPFPAQGNQRRYVSTLTEFLLRGKRDVAGEGRRSTMELSRGVLLHDEIATILKDHGNRWMTTTELAEEVNRAKSL
jgi:hypothetical protein